MQEGGTAVQNKGKVDGHTQDSQECGNRDPCRLSGFAAGTRELWAFEMLSPPRLQQQSARGWHRPEPCVTPQNLGAVTRMGNWKPSGICQQITPLCQALSSQVLRSSQGRVLCFSLGGECIRLYVATFINQTQVKINSTDSSGSRNSKQKERL